MPQDIMGIIDMLNIVGLLAIVYYISIVKGKRTKKRYILFYVLAWTIVYVAALVIMGESEGGLPLEGSVAEYIAANAVAYFGAFLIIDIIAFFAMRFFYNKMPRLQKIINKKNEEEAEPIQQKHKSKEK